MMSVATAGIARAQAEGEWLRAKYLAQSAFSDPDRTPPGKASDSKFIWSYGVGAVFAFVVGTGGVFTADYVAERDDRGYRLQDFVFGAASSRSIPAESMPHIRSSVENLARVREVFKPSVTELASLFAVSRQAIYNWQAGQPIAEQNAVRLEQLVRAADLLDSEGLADTFSVLRRKLPGGATFFEAVRGGAPAETAASALIALAKRELAQSQALSTRLANRARRPVGLGEVGAPHLDEQG